MKTALFTIAVLLLTGCSITEDEAQLALQTYMEALESQPRPNERTSDEAFQTEKTTVAPQESNDKLQALMQTQAMADFIIQKRIKEGDKWRKNRFTRTEYSHGLFLKRYLSNLEDHMRHHFWGFERFKGVRPFTYYFARRFSTLCTRRINETYPLNNNVRVANNLEDPDLGDLSEIFMDSLQYAGRKVAKYDLKNTAQTFYLKKSIWDFVVYDLPPAALVGGGAVFLAHLFDGLKIGGDIGLGFVADLLYYARGKNPFVEQYSPGTDEHKVVETYYKSLYQTLNKYEPRVRAKDFFDDDIELTLGLIRRFENGTRIGFQIQYNGEPDDNEGFDIINVNQLEDSAPFTFVFQYECNF